jgi:putative restriction endonuclease
LNSPVPLREVFAKRDTELRHYFLNNRSAIEKERLFFVIQADRLQCLNGAYLSQVSAELVRLVLDQPMYIQKQTHSLLQEVSTGEQLRTLMSRIGQDEFSNRVRKNYGMSCCFPDCDIAERGFLEGAHIARWSDAPELRGEISNGLCLCLMHDQAFEQGLFTIDLEMNVWVNLDKANRSSWAKTHLLQYHKRELRQGNIQPSVEALLRHWERTSCYPM